MNQCDTHWEALLLALGHFNRIGRYDKWNIMGPHVHIVKGILVDWSQYEPLGTPCILIRGAI